MPPGLIYRHICIYRFAMNLLYGFDYKKRFRLIFPFIKGLSVNELCFGDLYIAHYCKKNNIKWIGYDINKKFIERAINKNFDAVFCNLSEQQTLPKSDTCIILGSLYHFNQNLEQIYELMFSSSKRIIISEPIKNISAKNNLLGRIASTVSDTGNGAETFRYDEPRLIKSFEKPAKKYNFTIYKKFYFKKDIIIILDKCPSPK